MSFTVWKGEKKGRVLQGPCGTVWTGTCILDITDKQRDRLIHGLEMILDQYPSEDPSQLVNKDDAAEVAEIRAMLEVLRP